ncbi:hypothetical protein BGZ65_001583 [Modicella reniformis]|uniref:Uncharacterized protein n=1 Tax=Modicella reniformis TaxID=1440133 RepID=A0A9P6J3V7_9FUNG|nr:hypothetical protein BGZ65_001583 [Modicella reniformis]
MLINPAAQSPITMRRSPGNYHRRSVSCLAVASHHEHYNHPSYYITNGRLCDMIEGSASPTHQTRHAKRKSEGTISPEQVQKGLTNAGVTNVDASASNVKDKSEAHIVLARPIVPSPSTAVTRPYSSASTPKGRVPIISIFTIGEPRDELSAIFFNPAKQDEILDVVSPVNTPRRSLLSDLLNSQGTPSRLEQAANRRRMLKSMRRYSVDVHEMDFNLSRPSTRVAPMEGIPSEEEPPMLINGRQGFNTTPTVRYLRNPCHATVKTKLLPSTYRSLSRRGNGDDEEGPDYFGPEDRVW